MNPGRRGAALSPAGLLTLLAVAAVFLLLALLVREKTQADAADPAARRALRQGIEALRAIPPGAALLAVPPGERSATFSGELPVAASAPRPIRYEWTVQPLRWDPAQGRFAPCAGGERHELSKVTVRVRAADESPLGRLLASGSFLRLDPSEGR